MEFTHLHVHTEYSLLDGSNKIKECMSAGKGAGHGQLWPSPTMASCSASLIFTGRPGRRASIRSWAVRCMWRPIPGLTGRLAAVRTGIIIWCCWRRTITGYANLMKIVSKGFVEGYYYTSAGGQGASEEVPRGYHRLERLPGRRGAPLHSERTYTMRRRSGAGVPRIFSGKDNYFLELQDHGIPEQQTVNQQLLRMSQETGHSAGGHQRCALHLCGGCGAPRYSALHPDGQEAGGRGPDALRGRPVLCEIPGGDGAAVSLCAKRRWTIPIKSQSVVMWRSSSA